MIAVVQRVRQASVLVEDDGYLTRIGRGMCVLLAVEVDDTESEADWMAKKLAHLRIFPDRADRMNQSLLDIGGEMLLVSQFTLAGDASRGHRPSFTGAADPEKGNALYRRVADQARQAHGVRVRTGVFGAKMVVQLTNDGPVTVIVKKRRSDEATERKRD
ncbi:MAG: D-aminoacyl-tRNA deacylase [Planctomycetota bacterium]|jgi:D-tyrosyl-tRNA(Tyr) deacylase